MVRIWAFTTRKLGSKQWSGLVWHAVCEKTAWPLLQTSLQQGLGELRATVGRVWQSWKRGLVVAAGEAGGMVTWVL